MCCLGADCCLNADCCLGAHCVLRTDFCFWTAFGFCLLFGFSCSAFTPVASVREQPINIAMHFIILVPRLVYFPSFFDRVLAADVATFSERDAPFGYAQDRF